MIYLLCVKKIKKVFIIQIQKIILINSSSKNQTYIFGTATYLSFPSSIFFSFEIVDHFTKHIVLV